MQIQNALLTGSTTVYGPITFVSGSIIGSSSYAATSSYANNFTVGNTLTAQTLVVQTITSSITYSSGSNIFGNQLTNTQTFTGSVNVTGSVNINSSKILIGDDGTYGGYGTIGFGGNSNGFNRIIGGIGTADGLFLNAATTRGIYFRPGGKGTNDVNMLPNGNVGLGVNFILPTAQLHISGSGSGSLMQISSTVSSSIFFVSGSGNVGIGTTTPGALLEVYNSQNAATTLRLNNPSTGTGAQVNFQLGNSSGSNMSGLALFGGGFTNSGLYLADGLYIYNNRLRGGITIATEQPTDIVLATNSTERLRISSSGAVLQKTGSYTIDSGVSGIAGVSITPQGTNSDSGFTNIQTFYGSIGYTSPLVLNRYGGNVGVGVTNPLSVLTVAKTTDAGRGGEISIINGGTSAGTEAALNFGFGNSSYNADNGNAQIKAVFVGGNEVTDMVFTSWNGSTFGEKMRISGSGNVGIGTASPEVKLHVSSTIYATKVGGTNSTPAIQVRASGGGPRIQTYGLDADSRAWMGLGTDMAGNPYEHSVYFSAPDNQPTYGRVTFGAYDGTTYSLKMTILRDGSIGAPTGTNIYNPSDQRLKRNIVAVTEGLNKIMGLNPVKFNWVENFSPDEQGKDMLGFIAQEVQSVVPEAVESFSDGSSIAVGESTVENPLRVNEKFIIPVLVKAIQELKAKLDEATNKINALESK